MTPSDTEGPAEASSPDLEPSAPEPEAPATGEDADGNGEIPVTTVLDRLDAIEERLIETARLGDRHADHVERLHTDNQRLKEGEIATATMPLLRDLMRLSDDLERMTVEADDPERDLALIRDTLLGILRRNGLERREPSSGEPFDSARHSAAGTQPTDDPSRDRTIATVLRAGFVGDDGRTVRAAEVEVLRHPGEGGPPPAAPSTADDSPAAAGS